MGEDWMWVKSELSSVVLRTLWGSRIAHAIYGVLVRDDVWSLIEISMGKPNSFNRRRVKKGRII